MRILEFEWDKGNEPHIELKHGITASQAEQVFDVNPLFRKTKRGHYAAFGPTIGGRLLLIIFE